MKNLLKKIALITMMLILSLGVFARPVKAVAQETTQIETEVAQDNTTSAKAWAAGIALGMVAAAGAIAMAMVISKSVDGIARQPEVEGKIRTTMMLGLVFVETAIIYALIVAILIIFVL